MPGGAPQGTILGVLIFIFQMNELNTVPSIPRSNFLTPPGSSQQTTSCKFIDDNITAEVHNPIFFPFLNFNKVLFSMQPLGNLGKYVYIHNKMIYEEKMI